MGDSGRLGLTSRIRHSGPTLLALTLGLATNACAALVKGSDASFSWTSDSATSLDWLDFAVSGGTAAPSNHVSTVGRSYVQVLTELGAGGDYEGWRYATRAEAERFVRNVWGADIPAFGAPYPEYSGLTEAVAGFTGYTLVNASYEEIFGFVYTGDISAGA